MGAFSASKAAELLASSRLNGVRLRGFPADLAPGDLDQGYAIQSSAVQLRALPVAAFKVGLTTEEAQRAAGETSPIVGCLAAPDLRWSPARVIVNGTHLRIVEAEVIFEIGRDLRAADAPFSASEIAGSIAGAFAGIEICDSRFSNGEELSIAHLVADNSNADLLVIGEALAVSHMDLLAGLPVILVRRGQPPISGSTEKVLGHPLKSVAWLANWLASKGEGLRRGQFIASGSCTGITEAAQSDIVVATFGAEARASVEFAVEA